MCAPTPSTSSTTARCAPPSRAGSSSAPPSPAWPAPSPSASSGWRASGPVWSCSSSSGVVLTVGYNLELLGGRLHNDVTFAAAWGAFPVLTAYYAQAETLRLPALAAAAAAYWLSAAQRSLSTPARTLRRRVASVDGTVTYDDGRTATLSTSDCWRRSRRRSRRQRVGVVALAVALVVYRITDT